MSSIVGSSFPGQQKLDDMIIRNHFLKDGDVDVTEFIDMDMNVLPQAISWVGRDDSSDGEHTLMFAVLQSMPCLFELRV